MAAWHCVALITPYDPVLQVRREVRVSSVQSRIATGLGKQRWFPAIVKPPVIAWQGFEGDFSTSVSPASTSMEISLLALADDPSFTNAARFFWRGADIEIFAGRTSDPWPWRSMFKGQVTADGIDGQKLTLQASVNSDVFEADVLTATYAGTGGVEGGDDIKGRLKPLALGWPQNVEPVLINAVYSIYQFSAYGPIEAVTALYERGSDFGSADADYADYAALQAATVPDGGWATCLAEGLVRLGAPEAGVITGDLKGHEVDGAAPRLTGAIISLLASLAGVDPQMLVQESLDSMDAAVPYPVSIHLTQKVSFAEVARRMVLPCNHQAGVSALGEFYVAAPDLGKPERITLHAQGKRMPQVAKVRELGVSRPYWRTVMGAARCWRVHAPDEIAWGGYTYRGKYEATAYYKSNDLVFADDGRAFIYVNATPGSGNAPPALPATSNSYWSEHSPATVGAPSGTSVGGRDADDVASTIADGGGVADDQVDTPAVVDEAIVTKTYAFTSGAVTITSGGYSYQEVQSATITTSGEDVEVEFGTEINVIDNCKYQYRILRDGTPLIDIGPITVNTNDSPYAFLKYVDSPAAGTYEYTAEVACNDANDIQSLNRAMFLKEIKR